MTTGGHQNCQVEREMLNSCLASERLWLPAIPPSGPLTPSEVSNFSMKAPSPTSSSLYPIYDTFIRSDVIHQKQQHPTSITCLSKFELFYVTVLFVVYHLREARTGKCPAVGFWTSYSGFGYELIGRVLTPTLLRLFIPRLAAWRSKQAHTAVIIPDEQQVGQLQFTLNLAAVSFR